MQRFDEAYFDAGVIRTGTDCVKWDEMRRDSGDPDMIPMWVADMDFQSPPAVQEAVKKMAAQGTWGYMHPQAKDAEALCAFWARRHGTEILPEQVVMSPCVVTGMHVALRALTRPGDGVLIHPPVYGPFAASIADTGRRLVESPLFQDADGVWRMDFSDMEARLAGGGVAAVLFCSPHNPCGRCWTKEELSELAALCRRYGAALISDEIHADFVYAPNRHTCMLNVPGGEDAVMLCAASKTFNIAGLQQSAIVCRDEEKRRAIEREVASSGVHSGNAFALAGTRAAYTEGDAWLDGLIPYLRENRDEAMAFAEKHWPRVKITPLQATYLMWLDCRALGLPQEELLSRVKAAHVMMNDGLFFGEAGRGFLRMNIGCPRAQLRAALSNLKDVLK